ncbi:hypothetical protein M8J76_014203 [Diaphorina citri]|nr:hypothetical protein M8J76_014203 [Diaphorina citri]
MNGEIPSVPITTLAGISSLTDLLPEMPLPSPLQQTLSNKSLLFHPRVAEEANILLSGRDEHLAPLLAQSLSKTSADHIELKDHYAASEHPVDQQQNVPELLKAILSRNPNKSLAQVQNQIPQSPAVVQQQSYQLHPGLQPSLPQQNSPFVQKPLLEEQQQQQFQQNFVQKQQQHHPVSSNNQSPYPGPPVLTRSSVITSEKDMHNGNLMSSPSSSSSSSTVMPPQLHPQLGHNLIPNNFNSLPSKPLHPSIPNHEQVNKFEPSSSPMTSLVNTAEPPRQTPMYNARPESNSTKPPDTPKANHENLMLMKEPVIVLDRMTAKDQEQVQKDLKEAANKSNHNHKIKSDSESEDDDKSKKRSFFKNRDRERRRETRGTKNDDNDANNDENTSMADRIKKRKREEEEEMKEEPFIPPKPKLQKVERKLVPVLEMLSVEELMETNTYHRFNRTAEKIFDSMEDVNLTIDAGDDMDEDVPPEVLIPKYQLQDLTSEAAKLKNLGATSSVPADRIIRLLSILEKNIRDGAKVTPLADPDDDEDQQKLWMELAMERVMRAVDASLTVLYILTSPKMSKRVYIEDVIDRVVIFAKFQLHNTVYPAFDPVYRVSKQEKSYSGSARKKRQYTKEVREKSVLTLYTKLSEVVGLISELLAAQTLTDTTVLHASSMGVSPFFVENISELQLSSLKLVTTIFTKYEKHRKLLLDDILASMARLPSTKRNLRTYRLNSSDYIQMLTALVLQLIQCMVVLPESLGSKTEKNPVDPDVFIMSKFKAAKNTATSFLHVFLAKCSSKSEEIDYRPIFENLIQDLLVTVNKPEWPAAELMLSVLGSLLVSSIINKSLEMSLRMASLDYLGSVSARLRKDSVQSKLKLASIDLIIRDIRYEELKDEEGNLTAEVKDVKDDDERTEFLQRVLLDYLAVQSQSEASLSYARYFHITQWYQDIINSASKPAVQKTKPVKDKKKKRKRVTSSDEESSESEEEEEVVEEVPGSEFKKIDAKKKFLLSKITPYVQGNTSTQILQTYVDYESAELIARYLGSKQNFSQSFDTYLRRIISVVMESSVLIRTKAMKCLTSIVEVDPEILAMKDMQIGVSVSFLDHSTSVREAAVDLVGKYILNKPELIDKYYNMLSARILDTGVSVRKRVIKILKDICIEYPEYPKIPEICVKMIRRVNDEEGIRKLVMEVFHNMWFMPVHEKPLDTKTLTQKVMHITDVVHACQDIGLEWFEQLLQSLFKPKDEGKEKDDVVIAAAKHVQVEPPKQLLLACKQIVNCLIDYTVRLDSTDDKTPQKLLSCLQTLFLLAKIRPQLLIDHAITIQPYLSLRCHTKENFQVISYAAKILELVVPLIENASESFLANLESDSVKLVVTQRPNMITSSCITCLSSIVNSVTKNFKLVRDCFSQFYKYLTNFRDYHEKTAEPDPGVVKRFKDIFKKAVLVIGLLLRHFNFTDPQIIGDTLAPNIKDQVVEILMYFLQHRAEYRHFILKAIGHICIRHYELMLTPELKAMYQEILKDPYADTQIKRQVLNNIEIYLSEEEKRMIQQDLEWAKLSKNENLKEMCDVTSGMASTIVQLYLKEIVESFLHPSLDVRHAVLKVIQLILNQGLLNPVQLVPYLICMSTDPEKPVSNSADKQLQEIEKKYPGFIYMKSQQGIRLSYQFQKTLQNTHIVRGFREKEGELPGALNGFLYSILKSKQQRRAVALSFLKQFDEQAKTSLEQMLYLTDNMAYFPYQVQDEPLFIIHNIDIILSVNGTNLIQSFKEALLPLYGPHPEVHIDPMTGLARPVIDEDEDEDQETLLARMPEDAQPLVDCMTASQGCILLLVLKNHLKAMYGFNDAKISQYSPSENSKLYEKAVTRKSNSKFNPQATLKKLQELKSNSILNEEERKALISEYLEFKHLIISLDPDEVDDEDVKPAGAPNAPGASLPHVTSVHNSSSVNTVPQHQVHSMPPPPPPSHHPYPSQQATTPQVVTPLKVPKLTIIAPTPPTADFKHHHHKSHKSRKSEKHKKHPKKRKKHRHNSSDEDDDSDENSDPDYE